MNFCIPAGFMFCLVHKTQDPDSMKATYQTLMCLTKMMVKIQRL